MRLCEWVLTFYFAWTSILALMLPAPQDVTVRVLAVNAAVAAGYWALLLRSRSRAADIARDWAPQALAILAYKQMGWFATAGRDAGIEHEWILWDRFILDDLGGRAAVESLGAVLPALLELSYALVYAVPPFTMALLYRMKLRRYADAFLTTYLLGLFLCYGQFPFWPSEPPRVVYAGLDLPGVHTFLRSFNLWVVGTQGIHTSVFPSAHVSGVVAAAMAAPGRGWIFRAYLIYAALVSAATVYGRYHYAVDAVGGLFVGLLARPLASLAERLRDRAESTEERAADVGTPGLLRG